MSPSLSHYRVAAIQMVSTPDVEENCAAAGRLIARAAQAGARLVVLPEYFPMIGATDEDRLRARERMGEGPIQSFLREAAVRHKLWIIGGSLPLEASDDDRLRNACLVVNDHGETVARYDKMHLFGFRRGDEHYDESRTIEAGDRPVALDSPFGRIGLSICYDLRFPELYRNMGEVDLIAVPAAFTYTTGQAHWELLLRARAVENQCHVIAAAQGGVHPTGRRTYGRSMVIDPWGVVLAGCEEGAGVVLADVDLESAARVREDLPALAHRRL